MRKHCFITALFFASFTIFASAAIVRTPQKKNILRDVPQNSTLCVNSDGSWPEYTVCSEQETVLPAVVYVGVYFTQLGDVDAFSNLFHAQGYIWYRWRTCEVIFGDYYRPDLTLLMENVAEFSSENIPEHICPGLDISCPVCNKPEPGWSYFNFKFNAQFFMTFGFTRYPLDTQILSVAFEDMLWDYSMVRLIPEESSGIADNVQVPGYSVSRSTISSNGTNVMHTDFSLGGGEAEYSHCEIGLQIKRSAAFFTMKVIPPAIVTLAVSISVLWLDPTELQGRLGSSVSGVLSMVFLSTGTGSKIPDVGQVTVADWVYNWYFLILLATVIETIVVHRWLKRFNNIVLHKALEEADPSKPIELHPMSSGTTTTTSTTAPANATTNALTVSAATQQKADARLFDLRMRRAKLVDKITAVVIILASTIGTVLVSYIAACL